MLRTVVQIRGVGNPDHYHSFRDLLQSWFPKKKYKDKKRIDYVYLISYRGLWITNDQKFFYYHFW